jgi:branched-chain amino acid transport system substrate-binding protein
MIRNEEIVKRTGASTSVVAGLFIVGLLIGAGVMYALAPSIVSASTTTVVGTGATATTTVTTTVSGTGTPALGTVTIGVLTELTGSLSSEGLRVQAYANQAVKDINAWVANTQWAGKVTFQTDVVDYAGSPTTADQEVKTFSADGVAAVVGPLNSGSLIAIYGDATTGHVVLISPSSTSPALAGVSPYVYRTAPNDVFQGAALSAELLGQGVKGVIITYIDDTYGSGLYNYTNADFSTAGGSGVTVDAVPYSPTLAGVQAFNGVASTINADYSALSTKYGASSVAILAISFEELGYLLKAAQASYPTLLTTPQPWYGTDGEQGDTALTNSTYGSLMLQVRMPASVFGYTNSSRSAALCAEFAANPNLSCDSYALGGYDDTWLAALSILDCGANSGQCVSKVFTSVADSYFGVTGWTQLSTPTGVGGDRAGGPYQIWCVLNQPAVGDWVLCGQANANPAAPTSYTVTWLPGLQPTT